MATAAAVGSTPLKRKSILHIRRRLIFSSFGIQFESTRAFFVEAKLTTKCDGNIISRNLDKISPSHISPSCATFSAAPPASTSQNGSNSTHRLIIGSIHYLQLAHKALFVAVIVKAEISSIRWRHKGLL